MKELIKKLIKASLLILVVFFVSMSFYVECNYIKTATIQKIADNLVVVEDNKGYTWELIAKDSRLTEGMTLELQMDDNNTSIFYDDIILNYKIIK